MEESGRVLKEGWACHTSWQLHQALASGLSPGGPKFGSTGKCMSH